MLVCVLFCIMEFMEKFLLTSHVGIQIEGRMRVNRILLGTWLRT